MATGERTKDPGFLDQAFQDLIASQAEFPIKVEGAKTLPYTAVLVDCDAGRRKLLVKLFRPLPPALAAGAGFELVFSALGKRYEGRIALVGREGYLQYRFDWPASLLSSDRRLWKRYPFRPRENVFVTAQDNEIPCHGLTGSLTNLSLGGCLFRVDRVVRLDDGMPVPPRTCLATDGKGFSMLRIHGLSRSEVLEARGLTMRVEEVDSNVLLAVAFQGMDDAGKDLLTRVLEAREHRGASPATGTIERGEATGQFFLKPEEATEATEPTPGEPEAEAAPEAPGSGPLRRLDRRTARLLVVAKEGDDQAAVAQHLQAHGFWRLDLAPDLFAAHARLQAADQPFHLLVVDLEPNRREGLEAMGAVRHLEPLLRSFGELPVAFSTRLPDPMLGFLDKPNLGAVAQEDPDPGNTLRVLDRLLAMDGPPQSGAGPA